MPSVLLIHPPLAKACEAPAGIAQLAGALRGQGVRCTVLDANLEGQVAMLSARVQAADRWTTRAVRDRERNLALIRTPDLYAAPDRYRRVVMDLNRLLERAGPPDSVRMTLANYQDRELSPTRSADLLRAAEHPRRSPFYGYFARRLTGLLEHDHPELIGFSLNYLSQALCTFAMVGFLRSGWPDVRIILGGGLVTSWLQGRAGTGYHGGQPDSPAVDPRSSLFDGLVDEMVAGPGEAALLRRCGIVPAVNPDQAAPDFAGLPTDEYLAPGFILPYSASRGCYWNRCAFCPEPAEGNRYLPRGRRRVVADLRNLVGAMRPVLIHLLDNAVGPAVMNALIEDPPGAPWYGFSRFSGKLADVDFCRALRRSGCVMLKLGLESGNQGVLDRECKGVDLGLAEVVLDNLRIAGIAAYVYLLFGTPSEAEGEARATLEFTARHARNIGFLNLAIFNLPLAGQVRAGLEIFPHREGDLSLYAGFRHPRGWDRNTVRRFLDREFRRHPAIAPILRRDPPLFTSNHAPFFAREALSGQAEIKTVPGWRC